MAFKHQMHMCPLRLVSVMVMMLIMLMGMFVLHGIVPMIMLVALGQVQRHLAGQVVVDGYYSSPHSKHFRRFLVAVGVKTRKNAFHCCENACRDSDISKEVMDALQGHGEEGISGRYGRRFFLKKLAEAMARLRYEGLDLSHLRPKILTEKSERSPDQAAE